VPGLAGYRGQSRAPIALMRQRKGRCHVIQAGPLCAHYWSNDGRQ
jgi:hypothetical protein